MSQSKLHVGNLSFDTSEDELRTAFASHGTVESVNMVTDRDTGRSRGFAFLEMSSGTEAQTAIEAMNGQDLQGRPIKVSLAKPRVDRNDDNGGFGGGRRKSW